MAQAKYGKCTNKHGYTDKEGNDKECTKYQNKEVQKVLAGKEFVCSECGSKLMPCKNPEPKWKKYAKYAGIASMLVAVIFCIYFFVGGGSTPPTPSQVQDTIVEDKYRTRDGVQDTLRLTIVRENGENVDTIKKEILYGSKAVKPDTITATQILDAKKGYTPDTLVYTIARENEVNKDTIKTETLKGKKQLSPTEPESRIVFSGTATYDADLQEIRFNKPYRLDLHTNDGDVLYISAGDKITVAKVRGGYLLQGNYKKANGDERFLTGLNNKL